jgi:hypothetical protein
MSKLSITEPCRRALSSVLWIAVATFIVLGLSAGTASAQERLIEICHKGKTIMVDVHAVPAHLQEHGDLLGPCGAPAPCGCGLNFDPVACPNGKTYANQCFAACDGQPACPRLGICSNIFDPVVCNGVVYANECQARLACDGPITVLCPCPLIYAPVRCADGNVYINACVAQCQGASGCTPVQ